MTNAKGKIIRRIIDVGLTTCFSFCMHTGFGQELQTITDTKDILIGEQVKLKVKAIIPLNAAPLNKWIILPDSIPHFEIVKTGDVDSTDFKDNSKTVEQTITITSFDSGRWVFPSLPVEFADDGSHAPQIRHTDSFFVNVSYSPPDSTNQLRDIKPIMKVSVTDYFWYYIIGGAILLLVIIFLLYRYFKRKKPQRSSGSFSNLSPYDEAMAELKTLSQLNLQDATEIKIYHTKLASVFKNYTGRKQARNLMNETTGDLLISLKKNGIGQEDISKLATALRCTDAVKFAKYLPLSTESEDCLLKIKETIELTERQTINNKP